MGTTIASLGTRLHLSPAIAYAARAFGGTVAYSTPIVQNLAVRFQLIVGSGLGTTTRSLPIRLRQVAIGNRTIALRLFLLPQSLVGVTIIVPALSQAIDPSLVLTLTSVQALLGSLPFLVGGVMPETLPHVVTTPRTLSELVLAGSQFTLVFNNPTTNTISLLQDGTFVSMTIWLQRGKSVVVPVRLSTSSGTTGDGHTSFIVLCTVQQDTPILYP